MTSTVLFRRHYRLLILWTIIVGIIGFAVSEFVITPQHTATTEILVNQKHSSSNQVYNNQQTDVQLVTTYKDLITNQVILDKVSKQLDSAATARRYGKSFDIPAGELKSDITISNQQNSQVFSVAVKTDDPQKSAAVANTIAQVFKKQIKKIMSVNVTIVSRAATPAGPSFPNVKLFTLAGAVLGLLLSAIYLIIKELTDTTITSDDFLTEELGLTNLGHIAHFQMSDDFKVNKQQQSANNSSSRRV